LRKGEPYAAARRSSNWTAASTCRFCS
jgi:hypothetical protein